MITAGKYISRRALSRTEVFVRQINGRVTEEELKSYRLFKNSTQIKIAEKISKRTGKPMSANAIISFETEVEKQQCLIDSLYYSGNSLHQAAMLPISEMDWHTDPKYFFVVHPHSPFDISMVNNIDKDVNEQDLMDIGIEGLEEVRLFKNEQKFLQTNNNAVDLKQFAQFYFINSQTRNTFEYECRNKQHVVNGLNLVAKGLASKDGKNVAPNLVGQSRVTMQSKKRM